MLLPKRSFSLTTTLELDGVKKFCSFCCLLHDLPTYLCMRMIHFHASSSFNISFTCHQFSEMTVEPLDLFMWTMLFSCARFVTRFVSLYHFLSFESHIIKGDISKVKRMRMSVICMCFIISIKKVKRKTHEEWRCGMVSCLFLTVCASFYYSLDTS